MPRSPARRALPSSLYGLAPDGGCDFLRIKDQRTGKKCDYKALAEEVSAKARRDRVPWRQAAEHIAAIVNSIKSDSVVRSLNRYRQDSASDSGPPSPDFGPLPGLAMLYRNIEQALDGIDQEIENAFPQSDLFYEIRAQRLGKIRHLLETLQALTLREKASVVQMLTALVADLGERDDLLEPSILWEGELELVKMLIERTERLQNEVATLRPNRTWEKF